MQLRQLQQKFNTIASLDLDIILAHALKKPKEFLYSHPEYPISNIQYLRLRWFVHRYRRGYPIAYITRHKEFYGLDFYVNKHTLIPRPETELMVDEVVRITNYELRIKNNQTILIDVGTGSGCISIAIAKNIKYQNIKTFATDISRSALRVAKKNAKKHNVKINFLHGNLLGRLVQPPLPAGEGRGVREWFNTPVKYAKRPHPVSLSRGERVTTIIITANLPYLTAEQFAAEPSIHREPRAALVAGEQGLALYRKLLQQISQLPTVIPTELARVEGSLHSANGLGRDDKTTIICFLEIDPSQSPAITRLINKLLPNSKIEIKTDLAGKNRLVIIKN